MIDLVAAGGVDEGGRAALARALFGAVVNHAMVPHGSGLRPEAFALILDGASFELEQSLAPSPLELSRGGRMLLQDLVWTIPGREGARWVSRLARADPSAASRAAQQLLKPDGPRWSDDDWPDRIDVLARLPRSDPPPNVLLSLCARPVSEVGCAGDVPASAHAWA